MLPVPSLGSLIDQPRLLRTIAVAGGSVIAAQWALTDLLHIPGGGLGVVAIGGGLWWLSRPTKPPVFKAPSTVEGWLKRCDAVLDQFAALEEQADAAAFRANRQLALDAVVQLSLIHI